MKPAPQSKLPASAIVVLVLGLLAFLVVVGAGAVVGFVVGKRSKHSAQGDPQRTSKPQRPAEERQRQTEEARQHEAEAVRAMYEAARLLQSSRDGG